MHPLNSYNFLRKEDSMLDAFVVGIGGFCGAVLRYLIGLLPINSGHGFPVKTFAINLAGCFLIGIVAALAAKNSSVSPKMILFLKVGLCGGFTTFSSFALETTGLLEKGQIWIALLYAVGSVVAGVGAVYLAELMMGR